MKRSKIILACTAGLLAVFGITSAKIHKHFIPQKKCFFQGELPGLCTIPVWMYTQGGLFATPSAAVTVHGPCSHGTPCYSTYLNPS